MTMDRVPVPTAGLEMEIVEGEVLLYDPRQTRATYLNATAALVWGLCDGRRSVGEIIKLLAENYPDAPASLTDDVLVALRQLHESGLLAAA